MKKQIANIITSSRILCAICLLFSPVLSVRFYTLYLFCGITDMVDGAVARKTKATSNFGAKLDTIADFVFITVSFIKLLPIINVPKWLWIWTVLIAIIKIVNVIRGYFYKKRFISLHTVMNKITGFLLFLFPLTFNFIEPIYFSVAVCPVAMFAAIQEGFILKQI